MFRPERPPRLGKSTFWRFWPVSGPEWGRKFSLSPPDPLKPVNAELPGKFLNTTQCRQSKKVAQRERGSDEKFPNKTHVAPSYFQNSFLVGWVSTRQNRSPTEEMAPSAPQNGHTPGPRDTWDPTQGLLGPHLACKQIWSVGVSPRTAAKTGKIHFLPFLARFGP